MGTINGTSGNDTLTGTSSADSITGDAGNDQISGEGGNDTLFGGDGNDSLYGGEGADSISGESGNDLLDGGNGNDSLYGGAGADALYGGAGDDLLEGGADDDSLNGGAGDDRLYGGDGNDTLVGGEGNDTMVGGEGADHFVGNAGLDIVDYSASNAAVNVNLTDWTASGGHATGDTFAGVDGLVGSNFDDTLIGFDESSTGPDSYTNHLSGGAGNDYIEGRGGDDSVYGGADNDTVYGGDGNDTVEGGDGNDQVHGDGGNDIVRGDAGDDKAYGGAGDDQVYGGTGNDEVYGGEGNDSLFGGADDDKVYGGNGVDTLYGDAGNDTLYGGGGNDWLFGGEGRDHLVADGGNDTLYGGAGDDVFYVNTTTGQVLIADFGAGNTGSASDGNNLNNDFVDLTTYYNRETLEAWNTANPTQTYGNPLQWMRADLADGVLNAVGGGLRIQNGGATVDPLALNTETTGVVCFARGTRIATPLGEVAVEDLRVGDLVLTLDQGPRPLIWIGSRRIGSAELLAHPELNPVRISSGALGAGLPARDLMVSPQHRMLLKSRIVSRLYAPEGVFVAAKHLTGLDGIAVSAACAEVEYFHLLFETHQVLLAEGAPAESFLPGSEAQKILHPAALLQIRAALPALARGYPTPARRVLNGGRARDLTRRLQKNGVAAVAPLAESAPPDRQSA